MIEERIAPVQGYAAGIPWAMHLRAYDAYCKLYGKQQALIEGHCRGGFGVSELDEFIPGWREELSELHRLRVERDEWQRRAAEAEKSVHDMNQHVSLAEQQRDKLAKFKLWVHDYLDAHGVPHHPPGVHGAEGCRIGDRMDWLMERLHSLTTDRDRLAADRLTAP